MLERAELWRKTGQRGLLIASSKRLEKRLIAPQLLRRRQPVSLHAWRRQGPRKPSSCTTFKLKSQWGRAATGKAKKSCVFTCAELLQSCPTLCIPVDCGLPGFSVREGVLQARILGCIGQYWLLYPSRALYFLMPYPPTPLSTWCCQNPCDPSSCPTSTPGLTGADPNPPGQPQEQTPVTTHMQRWK